MAKPACPICGDPNAFPLWIDKEQPDFCPHSIAVDEHGNETRIEVKSVTDCPYQMGKAKQRAQWMKVCPEAFEPDGKLKPGMLGYVLERAQPRDEPLII